MMLLRRCLSLAREVRRLTLEVARLRTALALSRQKMREAIDERDQARRDADLLGLMAKDRKAALEFVRTRHDIHKWGTTEEVR